MRVVLILCALGAVMGHAVRMGFRPKYDDVILPERPADFEPQLDEEFRYTFLEQDGTLHDEELPGTVEIAATEALPDDHEDGGIYIVYLMLRYMPRDLFLELAGTGSVGLFTKEDGTTIFPEYEHLRDRPECEGTCAGVCSDTCTGDGRKYDELAGLGGIRGTCVDDNYMCTPQDPYFHTDNILVHEFAHTIHQYALPYVDGDWWNRIYNSWWNARLDGTWDTGSYAMSNHLEYFAEGAGVYFNVNHHSSSTGGMNSCGKPPGQFCSTEEEAREWLLEQDPTLFDALHFTFSDDVDSLESELEICTKIPDEFFKWK